MFCAEAGHLFWLGQPVYAETTHSPLKRVPHKQESEEAFCPQRALLLMGQVEAPRLLPHLMVAHAICNSHIGQSEQVSVDGGGAGLGHAAESDLVLSAHQKPCLGSRVLPGSGTAVAPQVALQPFGFHIGGAKLETRLLM